jgi:hypothetical protein
MEDVFFGSAVLSVSQNKTHAQMRAKSLGSANRFSALFEVASRGHRQTHGGLVDKILGTNDQ